MGRKSRLKAAAPSVSPRPETAQAPHVRRTAPGEWIAIAAALAILTLAVYWQVRGQEFINFDDDLYVTNNVIVQRGLTSEGFAYALKSMDVNWHPTTWLTYLVDVELFGVDPGAIKFTNVLFHVANTILLFVLLLRMTGARWRSAIVAALFAVHPLHVESVAWASERKDVVSTLFLLLTIWLYVSWTRNRAVMTYVAMCISFILGLAAKQMLVTLPFVLLLLDYWPLNRLELNRTFLDRVKEKIPLFVIMLWGVYMSILGQRAIGAVSEALPLDTRILNAISSYGRYLWKTIVPTGLAIPYPYDRVDSGAVIVGLIVLLALTAVAVLFRDRHRYLATGWFWFVGTLVPVIGIMQIGGQSMADRYAYIPHIGLFIAFVWGVAELAKRRAMKQIAAAFAAVAIAILAVLCFRQVALWKDSTTLFTHALNVTSDNFIAHLHLGAAQKDKAQFDEALVNYRAAHKIKPDAPESREGLANVLIELAKLDRARNDDAAAMKKLDEAQTVAGTDEKTRAAIALAKNDVGTAIELYRKQLAAGGTADERAKAHNDLGAALASAGQDEAAVLEYRKALEIAPMQFDARMNLGAILSRLDRNEEAIAEFQAAASIQPQSSEPQVYLALTYQLMQRWSDAFQAAQRAYAIDPQASNVKLTTALRMPYKDTNIQDYIGFLQGKASGR